MRMLSSSADAGSSIARAVQALVLSLLLFAAAFGTHEVMHLLVLYAVGGHGSIIVRPWQMSLVQATIYSLHVQPDQALGLGRQLAVNVLGPILAGIPLAILLVYVREPVVRAALSANVVILGFYALIEGGDLLLEQVVEFDAGFLTSPEFNYGVPLLVILVATFSTLRQATDVQVATG